jgi:AraC-like DNA-binding protein
VSWTGTGSQLDSDAGFDDANVALAAPAGRASVSELAAHRQFADSSHVIRTFKKEYGRTPPGIDVAADWHTSGLVEEVLDGDVEGVEAHR